MIHVASDNVVEILEMPAYPVAEASRLVGLSSTRVHHWLKGYEYPRPAPGGQRLIGKQPPIVTRETKYPNHASFLDLMDLLYIKHFLDQHISLQRLRKALKEAKTILGVNHFANETFFTHGREVFVKVSREGDAIIQLLSGGQWVMTSIIRQLSKKIEFHQPTGNAIRYYPQGQDGGIVIDPRIAFGAPSIIGKGTPTETIYKTFVAEHRRIESVCAWLNLSSSEVQAAIKYQELLAA